MRWFWLLLLPVWAQAANHDVPTGTSTVDCDTYGGGISAGDTITLLGTSRDKITIQDCTGTAANPIVVRNDTTESAPITISCSSGWCLLLSDLTYVTIDGTGKWSGAGTSGCGAQFDGQTQNCGIVVTNSGTSCPSALVKVDNLVKGLTIKGVSASDWGYPECSNGQTFQLHDNDVTVLTYPGEFYENWLIEDNYLSGNPRTGMYIGSNWTDPRKVPLRNIEVRYNLVEDVGCDGIKIKNTFSGTNSIHHNIIRRTGTNPTLDPGAGCNAHGVALFEAGPVSVYNNWVDTTGISVGFASCYSNFIQKATTSDMATADGTFYNNVGIDCNGHGVAVNNQGDAGESVAQGEIFNNTIIRAGSNGINISSSSAALGGVSTVQDNIACDSGSSDISSNVGDTVNNNETGTCAGQAFVDLNGDDFHLTASSNATDAGGNYASPPAFDYDDVNRPQGLAVDIGAYELIESGGGGGGGDSLQNPMPSPYTIDALETHYPRYLFLNDEATGTTVEDDGGATDCDLTISGATWGSDAYGNYLTFDGTNDEASNATCTGFSATTVTQCAIIKVASAPGSVQTIMSLGDASDASQEASAKVVPGTGVPRASVVQDGGGSFDNNDSQPSVTDGNWNLVCVRQSDTQNDVSVNGSAWDTATWAGTSTLAAIDTIALGARKRSSTDLYFAGDVLAAWIYEGSKSDAQIAAIWNSGNPWAVIGVDPSSGDPPGPVGQREQFQRLSPQ